MDEISDEVRAILIRDINELNGAISDVSEKIDALAPQVDGIDTKWLASRKRALSAEFQESVREILRDETKSAYTKVEKDLSSGSQHLVLASQHLEKGFLRMLLVAIFVGVLTGTLSTVVAGFFLGVF